jgi:hypothetical protein
LANFKLITSAANAGGAGIENDRDKLKIHNKDKDMSKKFFFMARHPPFMKLL